MKSRLEPTRNHESEKEESLDQQSFLNLPPLTSPNDIDTDARTLDAILQQSYHLISMLRIAMDSWIVASEASRNMKIGVIKRFEMPTVAIQMPAGIVLSKARLLEYMELCAVFGMTSIEYWNGNADQVLKPKEVVKLAGEYQLSIQFRAVTGRNIEQDKRKVAKLMEEARAWLDSGATYLVVDPFESKTSPLNQKLSRKMKKTMVDTFAGNFGLRSVLFDAPGTSDQTNLIDYFGPQVRICSVPIGEIVKMETYRRQPYAGFFGGPISLAQMAKHKKRHVDSPVPQYVEEETLAATKEY